MKQLYNNLNLLTAFLIICFPISLYSQVFKSVQVESPGALATLLTLEEENNITNLTVSGTLNSEDFSVMREDMPALSVIDLSLVHMDGDSIPEGAFKNNSHLTEVILPLSARSVGFEAFRQCNGLTQMNFPQSVTYIKAFAFYDCQEIRNISLQNVKNIGNDAFGNCNALTDFYLPYTLDSIGINAFGLCENINNVIIPASVRYIGDYAFMGCINLLNFFVYESNSFFSSTDGVLYSKDTLQLIQFPQAKHSDNFIVPSSVTSIKDHAFFRCTGLTGIALPPSLTSIGESAFLGCSELTYVNIPASVTEIYSYAFYSCSALDSIRVNRPVPVDLHFMGHVFDGVNTVACRLYVPAGSKNAYSVADTWKDFNNILEIQAYCTVSDNALIINAAAGSTAAFEITSNVGWTISSNQSWLSTENGNGTADAVITLTAEANNTEHIREAIITVSADGLPDNTIVVQQLAGIISGINEATDPEFRIYPLPVNDLLHIEGAANSDIMVYSMEGNLIVTKFIDESETIDMSLLPAGIYILKMAKNKDVFKITKL